MSRVRPTRMSRASWEADDGAAGSAPPLGSQSQGMGSWWKHYLTRDGGAAMLLEPGHNYLFGRSESCDIRLSSKKSSRQHAQINWDNGRPLILDLGSQNGTFVNDDRLSEPQVLKEHDEIRVGSYICTYRKVRTEAELDESYDEGSMTTADGLECVFTGQLDETPLVEVLTKMATRGSTGVLSFVPKQGEIGILGGRPAWAFYKEHQGEQAVLEMLLLKRGTYVFMPEISEERPRSISRSFAEIIAGGIEQGSRGSTGPSESGRLPRAGSGRPGPVRPGPARPGPARPGPARPGPNRQTAALPRGGPIPRGRPPAPGPRARPGAGQSPQARPTSSGRLPRPPAPGRNPRPQRPTKPLPPPGPRRGPPPPPPPGPPRPRGR